MRKANKLEGAVIATVLIVVGVFGFSACGENISQALEKPSDRALAGISIVSPDNGATSVDDSLMVKVEIENFVLDPLSVGSPKQEGSGHWHVYLDGKWLGYSVGDTYEIEEIPTGYHQLKVSLANNDHSTLILS